MQLAQPVAGWRMWLLAARPATLPAAVVPVLVGTAAVASASFYPLPFLAALVASILIQVGTNYANDVFDFLKGADTPNRLGPRRITQSGLVQPGEVLRATYLVFGLAVLVGLYLVYHGGWPILLIGLFAIAAGLSYTGGPFPLAYNGLGDLFVFIFFGLVGVVGSAYLQTFGVSPLAVVAAVPVGCLVTAIIVVNNLRDVDGDRQVGKRTLAVQLGRTATRFEYAVLVVGAYLVPPVVWLLGWASAWVLLPLLTLPLAFSLVRFVATTDGAPLNLALKRTGQLHLLFGVLFSVGLLLW